MQAFFPASKKTPTATATAVTGFALLVKQIIERGVDCALPSDKIANLPQFIEFLNQAYARGEPLLSDDLYDIVHDRAEQLTGLILPTTALPYEDTVKITLPFHMSSMDKYKPSTEAGFFRWLNSHTMAENYVLSYKLDGISALLITNERGVKQLLTKGRSGVGTDISRHIPYLHGLSSITCPPNTSVRGELILPRTDPSTGEDYDNSRNLVSGAMKEKQSSAIVADIHFVAYECCSFGVRPPLLSQLQTLESWGLETVVRAPRLYTKTELTIKALSTLLDEWRNNTQYIVDGIIIAHNKEYTPVTRGNPKHAAAFKKIMDDQQATTEVIGVHWAVSKDGFLKPRVQIKPVVIGGAHYEFTSGFNGSYIRDKQIGAGAVIRLIRSGDVIPYILDVISPATNIDMPTRPYEWAGIDVRIPLAEMTTCPELLARQNEAFFKEMDIDKWGKGNLARLAAAGHTQLSQLLVLKKSDFLKVSGMKDAMANGLVEARERGLERATIAQWMAASGFFSGFNQVRLQSILDAIPFQTMTDHMPASMISAVPGVGPKLAEKFVCGIPQFRAFMHDLKKDAVLA